MICLILDRSGSMGGRENDVVNGVNSFIEEQKKLPDPASIAFVRFDTEDIERFRPMQSLAEVQPLTREDYVPRGGTPLLDAVGRTINQLETDWRIEKPDRCIVVVVTDGEENSSHEFTKEKIKSLIKAREDSKQWAFIYLGANVDAFAEGAALGFNLSNTAGYRNTARGVGSTYSTLSASVGVMRQSGSNVAHNLGGNIGEDGTVTPAKPPKKATNKPTPQGPTSTWHPPTDTPTRPETKTTWTPPT